MIVVQRQHLRVNHLIILVPGTTAPINTFPGLNNQGQVDNIEDFYSDDTCVLVPNTANSRYWNVGTFRSDLDHIVSNLKAIYATDFVSYDDGFGWNGFNNIESRSQAGSLLVNHIRSAIDRFFYPNDETLWIHLIGHSHGGNVINECLSKNELIGIITPGRIIKSVTYLSTPFFTNLHPIPGFALSRNMSSTTQASICQNSNFISVHNKYDITQQIIADFSVQNGVRDDFFRASTKLTYVIYDSLLIFKHVTPPNSESDFSIIITNLRTHWQQLSGLRDYPRMNLILSDIKQLSRFIKNFIQRLRIGLSEFVGNNYLRDFDRLLTELDRHLNPILSFAPITNISNFGRLYSLVDDFLGFISNGLMGNSMRESPIFAAVINMVKEIIQQFDNTDNVPVIPPTNFISRPIFSFDTYNNDSANYDSYLSALEAIEDQFIVNPISNRPINNPRNNHCIFDLLMVLGVNCFEENSATGGPQISAIRLVKTNIESVDRILTSIDLAVILEPLLVPFVLGLRVLLSNVIDILEKLIQWCDQILSYYKGLRRGTGYFAIQAHSLSHMSIFPPVQYDFYRFAANVDDALSGTNIRMRYMGNRVEFVDLVTQQTYTSVPPLISLPTMSTGT